ncbi:kinase-like domain-containing protein, partial [Mycena alexandri]
EFLACRGKEAQQLLDLLQELLDLDSYSGAKPLICKALLRLSRTSGLHPQCFPIPELRTIGRQVAAGGFGDIWKGSVGQQSVSVKVMRIFQDSDIQAVLKEFGREALIWRQLWHPNLLPFFGLYRLNSRLCLISPWMEHGNIMEFLEKRQPPPSTILRLSLMLDVGLGLQYLHRQNIVHGDLKAINILVTPSNRACIADFGLASITSTATLRFTHSTVDSRAGTARYQAPELLRGESNNHFGSDVYGFACVCYEILTGTVPFHDLLNEVAVILKVIDGQRPTQPASCSGALVLDCLWELLQNCWEAKAETRPTASQIVERLRGPSIRAQVPASTPDWDNKFTSKFRRSLQARRLLPSEKQIERILLKNCEFQSPIL